MQEPCVDIREGVAGRTDPATVSYPGNEWTCRRADIGVAPRWGMRLEHRFGVALLEEQRTGRTWASTGDKCGDTSARAGALETPILGVGDHSRREDINSVALESETSSLPGRRQRLAGEMTFVTERGTGSIDKDGSQQCSAKRVSSSKQLRSSKRSGCRERAMPKTRSRAEMTEACSLTRSRSSSNS